MFTERRDYLVKARTPTINHLHALLRDLVVGGASRNISAHRAAEMLPRTKPRSVVGGAPGAACPPICWATSGDWIARSANSTDASQKLSKRAPPRSRRSMASGPGAGCEDHWAGRGRLSLPERGTLRLLHRHGAGRSLSSGEVVRHRLSRGGDRQLNYALHMIAICQIAQDTRGRAYYLQEDRRREVWQGGVALSQAPHLRCRLPEAQIGSRYGVGCRRLTYRGAFLLALDDTASQISSTASRSPTDSV